MKLALALFFAAVTAHAQTSTFKKAVAHKAPVTHDVPTATEKPAAPIKRFNEVESGFYRGAFPETPEQFETLKRYHIKTVISLSNDKKALAIEEVNARKAGIRLIKFPLDGWKAPTDDETSAVQKLINDKSLRPLFLHCKHGRERTGVMIAIYRVETEGWSPIRAYDEMKENGFRTLAWNFRIYYKRRESMN